MSIIESIPPEVTADNQAVIEHLRSGKPLNSDVARRIRDRADRVTSEILREQGVKDMAVELIREVRKDA